MSALLLTALTGLCGLSLALCMVWGLGALGQPKAMGGSFWVCLLLTASATTWGLATGLRASSVKGTQEALHAMPVFPVAKVGEVPPGAVVALVGVAKATASARVVGRQRRNAQNTDPSDAGQGILAIEMHYTGEDEVEGEESDYISQVDYGRETDVAPFRLLDAGDKPLLVDEDAFKVLAATPAQIRQVDTNEYSAVVSRNLMESESKTTIADGATVTVSGVVVDQGEQRVLMSMGPVLSILTDRPWQSVLDEAARKAGGEAKSFYFALFFALLGMVTLMAIRKRAIA